MAPMVALTVEGPVAEVTVAVSAVSLLRPAHPLSRLLPSSVEAGGDVVETGIYPLLILESQHYQAQKIRERQKGY